VNAIFNRSADGTGSEAPLFAHPGHAWPNDWSSDGRWLLYTSPKPTSATDNDLWALPMTNGSAGTPVVYLEAPGRQQQAQLSPDGRFVAYGSDQSGTFEIYVQPFPDASQGKWMVSSGGGVEPRWSRDGRELFYFSGQALMAVSVSLTPTLSLGTPVKLFDAAIQAGYVNDSHRWQVGPDGQRFLLLVPAGQQQAPPLEVIVNWPALLQ
jgi:Tol biopolymer transport system component